MEKRKGKVGKIGGIWYEGDSHVSRRLSAGHTSGEEAEGLLDDASGVFEVVDAGWVGVEDLQRLVVVRREDAVVLGAQLTQGLREGCEEEDGVLDGVSQRPIQYLIPA